MVTTGTGSSGRALAALARARDLVSTLPQNRPGLFNPWRDSCCFDSPDNGPRQRLDRLAAHLDCDPRWILIGEAPGYQGCRYTGLAFTSERLLLDGAVPRVARCAARLTLRERPFSEPSATIVWKTLYRLGLAETTVLWNALQMHPFSGADPLTNRTPTQDELKFGRAALCELRRIYTGAVFIAIGKHAERALAEAGIESVCTVRHPANGGATAFADGLALAAARSGKRDR